MQKCFSILLFSFLIAGFTCSAQDLQSPGEFLGYQIGSQFTPHHKVISYFKSVANSNPKQVRLTNYGKTNEHRDLYIAVISSPENIQNLESIRQQNLANAGLLEEANKTPETAIVWLSYNVHGNEASATEASMQTLYKILSEKQDWLKNTVVIIDPCINPDGRDRYVNWYNQHKSSPYDVDPQAREHDEPWPGGRPNHYLFDLNRDWMWATQVETQQRLKIYNDWMPHIHVDFHEQGIDDNYYFAPAAKPFHGIITPWQEDFQTQIGKNHAKYFDKEGWLFFTRERFDLFYPSYGDTYPTYMGAIGMTYEQAGHGRAGLGILTKEKDTLTLKDRLTHHTIASLSTVEIASKNAIKLNQEFKKYFNNDDQNTKSYVIKGNTEKIDQLKLLLDKHQIEYAHAVNQSVSGYKYSTGQSSKMNVDENTIVVQTNQPKGKAVKVLFEPNAKLEDSLTYDITAWSLPYAYGLEAIASKKEVNTQTREKSSPSENLEDAFAYVCEWNSMADAKFLSALLNHDIKVRFSQKPFQSNGHSLNPGALIIAKRDNTQSENLNLKLVELSHKFNVQLKTIKSGFSDAIPDLGSSDIQLIHTPKVAVFTGENVSSLSYGEVWHYFEQQLEYPLTSLNLSSFNALDLDRYDVIIMPSGNYNSLAENITKLEEWVKAGGRLIGIQNALDLFANNDKFALQSKKSNSSESKENDEKNNLIPYARRERQYISNLITGAVFKIELDNTHPLAFGFDKQYFSLKLSSSAYKYLDNGNNVGYLKDNNVFSGFAGHKAKDKIEKTLVFGEERKGRGSVIYFVDNVLFRAFWENGKLFMANAVFFVNNDGD